MSGPRNFTGVDPRRAIAARYADDMLLRRDLGGFWLHDSGQDCGIAVFHSPSVLGFFMEVGFYPEAADVMTRELERKYVGEGDEPGYTRFGRELATYLDGLGVVRPRNRDTEATVALPAARQLIEPGSDEANLVECGSRWLRTDETVGLYVLSEGVRPRDYSDVEKAPRLHLKTRWIG